MTIAWVPALDWFYQLDGGRFNVGPTVRHHLTGTTNAIVGGPLDPVSRAQPSQQVLVHIE